MVKGLSLLPISTCLFPLDQLQASFLVSRLFRCEMHFGSDIFILLLENPLQIVERPLKWLEACLDELGEA